MSEGRFTLAYYNSLIRRIAENQCLKFAYESDRWREEYNTVLRRLRREVPYQSVCRTEEAA